jgi:murein DD-endopeptidase MepM/ murein hydrolase activator NlpD
VAGQAHVSAAPSYTLRRGDTLSDVARKAGLPVKTLAQANGIDDPDRVQAGRLLTLGPTKDGPPGAKAPSPAPPGPPQPKPLAPLPSPYIVAGGGGTHLVQKGETLTEVAERYDVSVAKLARANDLEEWDAVRAGRTLKLPGRKGLCPVRGADRNDFGKGWGSPRPGGRRHMGVDIFADRGTAVVASVAGTVEHRSGAVAGLAYYLRGDDGNTYYGAHLDSLAGRPGKVDQGDVIGRVGATGNAAGTPPHLHFEFKPKGGRSVDPYPTLRRWC